MASAWGLSWGRAWGNSWGRAGDRYAIPGTRESEVDFEPAWRKAVRLRNEKHFRARYPTARQERRARQIEIRAAKQALSGEAPNVIEAGLLALYVEWLVYQPIMPQPNTEATISVDYAAFLAMLGGWIQKWHQDEEDAILALLL